VVKGDQVAIAQSFYGLGIVANNYGVCANFGLGKGDSYLHFQIPVLSLGAACGGA
jgi:hypothetical protein